jgi:hypothetical protein
MAAVIASILTTERGLVQLEDLAALQEASAQTERPRYRRVFRTIPNDGGYITDMAQNIADGFRELGVTHFATKQDPHPESPGVVVVCVDGY